MQRGYLSEYFTGIASKTLSVVECSPETSNQHEFNGAAKLREIFGDEDLREIPARYILFNDADSLLDVTGFISWYDLRRAHPTRTEYRLYYQSNEVTNAMSAGDKLYVALRPDRDIWVIIAPQESNIPAQLDWLFGLEFEENSKFAINNFQTTDRQTNFISQWILDSLGLESQALQSGVIEDLIEPFIDGFPTTAIFSAAARNSLPEIMPNTAPDSALMQWMEREEIMFRALEKKRLEKRLEQGFFENGEADVDGFIKFSLSVQNRRKSRAGLALENHLQALFEVWDIKFSRGKVTENKSKPDFLFPHIEAYHNPLFSTNNLTMLGVKTTAKDRWRQILTEAQRIENKHLFTLEPAISENQTDEMRVNNVQLVLPEQLHSSYKSNQQQYIISLAELIGEILEKQNSSNFQETHIL